MYIECLFTESFFMYIHVYFQTRVFLYILCTFTETVLYVHTVSTY